MLYVFHLYPHHFSAKSSWFPIDCLLLEVLRVQGFKLRFVLCRFLCYFAQLRMEIRDVRRIYPEVDGRPGDAFLLRHVFPTERQPNTTVSVFFAMIFMLRLHLWWCFGRSL